MSALEKFGELHKVIKECFLVVCKELRIDVLIKKLNDYVTRKEIMESNSTD